CLFYLSLAIRDLPSFPTRRSSDLAQHFVSVVDVDVVPVGEVLRDLLVALAVGLSEVLERRIGEHDAEPEGVVGPVALDHEDVVRSEEHTSELQSRFDLVCRLLLEK